MADGKSALERYLEKQKAEKAAAAAPVLATKSKAGLFAKAEQKAREFADSKLSQKAPPPPSKPNSDSNKKPSLAGIERPAPMQPPSLSRWEQKALDAGAPVAPPPRETTYTTPPSAAPTIERAHVDEWRPITDSEIQPDGLVNAGFGERLIATFVDSLVLSIVVYILQRVVLVLFAGLLGNSVQLYISNINMLGSAVAIYAYYGYFYSTKGASPGKLMMNLEVTGLDGKTWLTPWKAFFRESIGKIISTIPFLMGYLIVAVRQDHRALHDLLFDTRVIRKRS